MSASSKRIEYASIIDFFELSDQADKSLLGVFPYLAQVKDIKIAQESWGIEYTFSYKEISKCVKLFAEGYPVNFYRLQSQSLPSSVIDLVNAELLLLIYSLETREEELGRELYLLGHDSIPGLLLNEDEILRLWMSQSNSLQKLSISELWRLLSPHPHEAGLANFTYTRSNSNVQGHTPK